LRRADVILVLASGRLIQTGTHDELVRLAGPYRDAALLQLMDAEQSAGVSDISRQTHHPAPSDGAGHKIADELKRIA
jgi:hypothetical protein